MRLRHKIEKRSAEKQRKERKHAKKHPELHRKKPAALNIPNSFPYKDQILSEIEEARRVKAEEQQKRREQAKLRKLELKGADADAMKDVDEEEDEEEDEDSEGDDEMDVSESEDEEVGDIAVHPGAYDCVLTGLYRREETVPWRLC